MRHHDSSGRCHAAQFWPLCTILTWHQQSSSPAPLLLRVEPQPKAEPLVLAVPPRRRAVPSHVVVQIEMHSSRQVGELVVEVDDLGGGTRPRMLNTRGVSSFLMIKITNNTRILVRETCLFILK